jgi:hypothetical protein
MCTNCNDIEINIVRDGYNGWSPELGVSTNCTGKSVIRLISWIPGSGDRPSFNGNIMTDQYLIDNPIYLGVNGFTNACDEATDITGDDGAVGANGATGEQGNDGAPGTNGCDPNITITAEVSGGGEVRPYPVTVLQTGEGAPCNPEYSFIFPIEMITDNAELTTAIDAAVLEAMSVTPSTTIIPNNTSGINNTGTPIIRYTSSSTFTLDATIGDSFISYVTIGNRMTVSFRISIVTASTPFPLISSLELKIPDSKTSQNTAESNAIGFGAILSGTTSMTLASVPIITTSNGTNTNYLKILFPSTYGLLYLGTNIPYIFHGQITFTIN